MANLLRFFATAEDERALLREFERFALEVYPVRVPPGWAPFIATAEAQPRLPEDSFYLAASRLGPIAVDKLKRGPDKGHWRVDEVRSPVIHVERSQLNDEGELASGQLWAELDVTQQTGRRDAAPDRFRRLFVELEEWVKKSFRKSAPKGFLVGPHAARQFKEGLVLRDAAHRGGTVRPYK